ncbi:MAG: hypothetical protein ACJAZV_001545 [Roseivirga sp.]|jgi:hypothetical protein
MITFFRKIRQNLLMENKTGKYFKYALGEIVLVVIGILIALQINTLNENRKNNEYEHNYLERILSDLNKDQTELQRHFKSDTLKLDAFTYIIRAISTDSVRLNQQSFLSAINGLGKLNWFEGNDVVFNEMKFSGKLSLISSEALSESIQSYYKYVEEVIKQESLYIMDQRSAIESGNDNFENSFLREASMPDRWNSNFKDVSAEDIIRFHENFNDAQKKEAIKFSLTMKENIWASNIVRFTLSEKSKATIKLISDYLDKEK